MENIIAFLIGCIVGCGLALQISVKAKMKIIDLTRENSQLKRYNRELEDKIR